jgi:dCTP deaminase
VLGATLEYISLPEDLGASVEGRSSWGRVGLIIATACSIAPGFKGCITLELVNNGDVPLVVYPGLKIAQLVLYRAENAGKYLSPGAKYDCPTGPQFSRIHMDKDIELWHP